ncbi:hypothetical protein LTS18_004330, partial [Coniosporium uncinatum]
MTVNILAFLCKAPHLSHAQFKDYYEQKHMPLVIQITGDAHPVVYKRRFMNHESAVAKPTKEAAEPVDFDAVTELVFRDTEHKDAWFAKIAGRLEEVVDDEARFIDR